jgi:hypothetical protein
MNIVALESEGKNERKKQAVAGKGRGAVVKYSACGETGSEY